MNKFPLFAIALVLIMGMSSCKYEEGPFISVVPKTERVANTWVVSTAVIDGQQSSEIEGFKEITFFKEGNCQMILELLTQEIAYSGTWLFGLSKETIEIDLTDEATGLFTYEESWTIKKLKEDELIVSYEEDNKQHDVTFVTK